MNMAGDKGAKPNESSLGGSKVPGPGVCTPRREASRGGAEPAAEDVRMVSEEQL